MKKLMKFVLISAIMFGGWALAAASLHVVRAPGTMVYGYVPVNVHVIPKNTLTFKDTYLDTTKWSVADVQSRPTFIDRLHRTGKADLVKQAAETPAPASVTITPPKPVEVSAGVHGGNSAATDPKPVAADTKKPSSIFDFSTEKK